MDIGLAFLNRDLQQEVFMDQPRGFVISEQKHWLLESVSQI